MYEPKKHRFSQQIYDITSFFEKYSKTVLGCNLETLHQCFDVSKVGEDIKDISRQEACDFFYEIMPQSRTYCRNKAIEVERSFGTNFTQLYEKLIAQVINRIGTGDKYYFQKNPTVRVQFPGVNTSSIKHRDSDFGHPKNELNFWVPMTRIKKTTNLWFDLNGVDRCVDLKLGELVAFDGDILHFTKSNRGKATRVSFDFRLLKEVDYQQAEEKKSIAQNISFKTEYYEKWRQ